MKNQVVFYLDCGFLSGAEKQALNNANFLQEAGWQVTILHRGIPELSSMISNGRLQVHAIQKVKSLEDKVTLSKVPRVIRPLIELFICLEVYVAVRRILEVIECDIFHVNNGGLPGSAGSLGAAIAGGRSGVKTFMTVNNLAIRRPPLFLLAPWLPSLLKSSVNRWVTGSTAAARELTESLSLTPERTVVIANGSIPPPCSCEDASYGKELFKLLDSRALILSVGHLESRKGHLGLLEVAHNLLDFPGVKPDSWVIGIEGEGPMEGQLRKEIAVRGLGNKVRLLGRTECLWHLYASATVLCHLSLDFEDLPNVISEAMSFKVPVVAFDVGGIVDQVRHGETGFLLRPGDYKNAAVGVGKILRDGSVHRTLGNNAARHYQAHLNPSNALKQYASLYGLTGA